jgi:fructosamine-3-kinase
VNVQEELLQQRIDPHLTDANLTELAVRAMDTARAGNDRNISRRAGGAAAAAVRGYRVLTGGCWNRVIGINAAPGPLVSLGPSPDGTALVCKISPHAHDERIIREYRVLGAFDSSGALRVPRPLYCDDGEVLPGTTLVMTRVPGVVMHRCYRALTPEQQNSITDQIAADITRLHKRRAYGFGGVELEESERSASWADFWLPRFDKVLEEAATSGVVPAQLIAGAREIRPFLGGLLEIGRESTMTHYDIWSGNVMIDPYADVPHVSGYIDVPGFFADYARELSFAMLFGVADRRFFETYLAHHRLDDGFAVRMAIYNLKMNIKHIVMYPDQYYYQQGASECLRAVRSHLRETRK